MNSAAGISGNLREDDRKLAALAHGSVQPRHVLRTFTSPAWSPDRTALAFSSDIDPGGAFYVYTIYLDGGEPRRDEERWPNEIIWRPRKPE